jgi:WD40 repeat protein
MDGLARLIALALVAGCAAAKPVPAEPPGPATRLRMANALATGSLSYAVGFASRGRLVAVELATQFELVVRDRTGRELARIELGGPDYDVLDLAVDEVGRYAWVASADGKVRAIDLIGHHIATEWRLGAAATAVALSRGGAYLATGDHDGVVCVRRLADGALLQCAVAHAGAVSALDASRDQLASASVAGEVALWRLPTLAVLRTWRRAGSANDIAFDPSGSRLAVAWSAAPPRRSPAVAARERRQGVGPIDSLAAVQILDLRGGAVAGHGHQAAVTGVAWTPDGRRVLSSSWDRTVGLWDAGTGQLLARLQGFSHLTRAVAVAPEGRQAAVAGWASDLHSRSTTLIDLLGPLRPLVPPRLQ